MSIVKTYKKVNAYKLNVHFGISKMEDIYTKRNGMVDEPHRHNYYTVLIVNKAKGIHKIDFHAYELLDNQIYFVAPGQVHQVIEQDKSIGYAMTFSNQFLIENSIRLSFIESLNLFQNYGRNPPLIPSKKQFNNIEHFANEIFKLFNSEANMKFLSIGAFLKLILIECNNICSINPIDPESVVTSSNNLIRDFKKEVELNFKQEHSTSFYADQLHITADHLNRVVKSTIGKTAKEYIQSRIIIEAKRLLYFTALTNKEIGYKLGFSEPANFSAFFKKHTKQSPSKFKKIEIKT